MPELPEVETVRRGLVPVMVGKRLVRTDVRRPDLRWPFPDRMAERLTDVTVLALRRRSKYILADLSSGETLIVHLGMSGRMLIAPVGQEPQKHDHVIFETEDDMSVTFNDTRRFGAMDLTPTKSVDDHKLLHQLGPEPLGNAFNADYLANRLKGRKTLIKSALLDQRIIAGLGNIYVCEVLWRSQILPLCRAGDLSRAQIDVMVAHIRATLEDAIAAGGSSLRDYRQADGELGYFQHSFAVYGREDAPCSRDGCAGTITRIVQAGRSSFFCPSCQQQDLNT